MIRERIEAQTTLKNSKVIRKIGKWTIELFTNPSGHKEFAASNGWNVYYPIIYPHNRGIAWDNPYPVPNSIHKYFEKHKEKLLKLQES